MPEEGPVERLVIYLCKYVSSPPISIRRIEGYDGQNVTYRYKDHRRGEVKETITAVEFIGRMIRHLPPKGFRMVRYYGKWGILSAQPPPICCGWMMTAYGTGSTCTAC